MAFERLIYTNSDGKSVEFSSSSLFHVNIRKDVTGLSSVNARINRSQIIGVDGDIETGYHVEAREINISGHIKSYDHEEQDRLINELQSVLSPHLTGTLKYEGATVREIAVRASTAPDIRNYSSVRWPWFGIFFHALDPSWSELYERTSTIDDTGTDIYYYGSKACGMEITMTASADDIDMDSLTVTNGTNVETITFRVGGGVYMQTDDELVVNTAPGSVAITLNDTIALERIDFANTVFPVLYNGTNTITWSITAIAYSAAATYAVGEVCEYSGSFYTCNTPIESPEAWTAGHWTATAVSDLFDVSITYTPLYLGR